MRYTIKDLRAAVERANNRLEEAGSPYRIREQGRNGYQAADLYNTVGDCLRMIGGGTSREVCGYVETEMYKLLLQAEQTKGVEA